jgi:hypothetical protein
MIRNIANQGCNRIKIECPRDDMESEKQYNRQVLEGDTESSHMSCAPINASQNQQSGSSEVDIG